MFGGITYFSNLDIIEVIDVSRIFSSGRAKNNYYGAKRDSIDREVREEPIKSQREREFNYSYNWPHDFYSLVELAQVEAGVEMSAMASDTGTEE